MKCQNLDQKLRAERLTKNKDTNLSFFDHMISIDAKNERQMKMETHPKNLDTIQIDLPIGYDKKWQNQSNYERN